MLNAGHHMNNVTAWQLCASLLASTLCSCCCCIGIATSVAPESPNVGHYMTVVKGTGRIVMWQADCISLAQSAPHAVTMFATLICTTVLLGCSHSMQL